MTTTSYTPVVHHVYNELDRIGILLGLPRLTGERNAEYKLRLQDVFVHQANSSYNGLINGLTRELGLAIFEAIQFNIRTDPPATTKPAIIFSETKCYIHIDPTNAIPDLTIDRFDVNGDSFTLGDFVNTINAANLDIVATLCDGTDSEYRSMTIFNQSNVKLVPSEDLISTARIQLANKAIISNSIVLRSANLTERVTNSTLLRQSNQYYIDTENGIFYAGSIPADGSVIRYKYYIENYIALASPVIIHNLQSDDFKTKMFEQVLDSSGQFNNSLPTALGADLINELYTVYPSLLGR